MYGGVDVYIHVFLASVLVGGEWLTIYHLFIISYKQIWQKTGQCYGVYIHKMCCQWFKQPELSEFHIRLYTRICIDDLQRLVAQTPSELILEHSQLTDNFINF
jgi:hypothetical protein